MPPLEYEIFINEYELGSLEFRLQARLKATETAIKILATNKKLDTSKTIETLYRQGITLMTVLGFLNKTYVITEWVGKYSKYLAGEIKPEVSDDLTPEQLEIVKDWCAKWKQDSGFLVTDDTDMTPYINAGYVELNKDNRLGVTYYTMTEKARKLK